MCEMIAVRIVCMDYYMSPPVEGLDPRNSNFRGSSIAKLPIIRIFGSLDDGSKVCLHVHGKFPYIYVPFDGNEDSKGLSYQLASGLDKALNISQGQASSNHQHVYEVTMVSAIPIYGYHAHKRPFFKISFYNPQTIKRACPLLQNGSVLGQPLQPHEAHIPYHQQFMIDYNLHGMNIIKLRRVYYRTDGRSTEEGTGKKLSSPSEKKILPGVKKMSVCSLEMDALAEDILNVTEIGEVNPGIEYICEEERMRRRDAGEDTQLSKFLTSERSMTIEATASSEKYRILLMSKLEETPESQDSLLDFSCLDNTVINEDADFLMSMLKDNEDAEADSVLSQQVKCEDDEDPDLRVPLASVTTPVKALLGEVDDGEEDIWNDSFFISPEDQIIAQVDGSYDRDDNLSSISSNHDIKSLKINQDKNQMYNVNQIKFANKDKESSDDYKALSTDLMQNTTGINNTDVKGMDCSSLFLKSNFKIDQLDGRNGSSSSEEEEKIVAKKRRRVRKDKTPSSPYPALQVVVSSPIKSQARIGVDKQGSPVKSKDRSGADKQGSPVISRLRSGVNKQRSDEHGIKPLSTDKLTTRITSRKKTNVEAEHINVKQITRSTRRKSIDCSGQNAKRKLSFQQLNATVVEETFPCRYSPSRNDRFSKKSTNYKSEEESDVTTTIEKSLSYITEDDSNVESSIPNLTDRGHLHSDYSTDIFSSNETSVQQTAAEKYDVAVSYIPVPGRSKDAKIVISGETSSSGLLTPYQVDPSPTLPSSSEKTETSLLSGRLTIVSDDDTDIISGRSKDNITSVSPNSNYLPNVMTSYSNDSKQNTVNSPPNSTLLNDLTVTDLIEDSLMCVEKTTEGHCVFVPKYNPPSADVIRSTMAQYGIPDVRNEDPYYSDPADISRSVEVGHNVLKIKSKTTVDLSDFESDFKGLGKLKLTNVCGNDEKVIKIVPAKLPPTRREVELWEKARLIRKGDEILPVRKKEKVRCIVDEEGNSSDSDLNLTLSPCTPIEVSQKESAIQVRSTSAESETSNTIDGSNTSLQKVLEQSHLFKETSSYHNTSHQITGASLDNTHGFKFSLENYQNVKSHVVQQHLTTVVVELHVDTRGALLPDPDLDAIGAIFYAKLDDQKVEVGVVAVNADDVLLGTGYTGTAIHVTSELELFTTFLDLVRKWDPDVLIGYEVETASWGYLVERGYKLGLNYGVELSRIPGETARNHEDASEMRIAGRIVLDLWRLLRHELALTGYSFENVVYHVLHERVAVFSAQDLTNWWVHKSPKVRSRTINFYLYRVRAVLRLLDHFDLLGRTSEMARLFGILFYEVLSRGSQFRVESMMLRLAKPANYIAISPSVQQRAHMRAPEFLPLILEPESKFYKDPVIVLDFQSLYPSMIIAYNYCFSTCVGRCENLSSNSAYEFGASNLRVSRARIRKLLTDDLLHFSPSGIGFVKPSVRDGILPRMLREILDTRLLVKNAMKRTKSNKTLQRVLHSRQLGLKLIANVTYGYTAANFSGRMPAVEIADSVVGKGRETLQRAIKLVENNPEWNARVVYGDTDSLFVLTPGRSRAEAFRIGAEIAESVTNANPSPVRLKLEKIYQPCILQTKKRYVGYLYESPEQITPDFDAKGIETVRRDGCPAVGKMLEKCLRMLFETRDVSAIKRYVQRQFHKLLSGRVSIQDLTFAKEYRGEAGYRPGACVPALELAKKWKMVDRRKEPRRSQRVPYIIVNGPPGLPLIRLVRSPMDLLNDPSLRPNALYYITKVIIPPINRCFLLIGADLNTWFNEMPRKQVQYLPTSSPTKAKKSTISQYFATTSCACCSKQTREGLCAQCAANPQSTAVILHEKIREWERSYNQTYKICQSCCGRMSELPCISLDCPVLYRLVQTERDAQQAEFVRDLIERRLPLDF